MLNHLAFSKDEDLMKRTIVPMRRRRASLMTTTFVGRSPALVRHDSKGSFKEGVNKKKQQLDRLLHQTEQATKNLHMEEKRNAELKQRLKEIEDEKNATIAEAMLPSLIAAKTNVSADLIRQILDIEKGLLKKPDPVKLFKPDREESEESKKYKSARSLPPFQDDGVKDFIKQMKNSVFKRTVSGKNFEKPLELIKHFSKKELPALQRNRMKSRLDFSLKSMSNIDFLKSQEKNKLNLKGKSVKKENLKNYLESISESEVSHSISKSSIFGQQPDKIVEGAFTKITK